MKKKVSDILARLKSKASSLKGFKMPLGKNKAAGTESPKSVKMPKFNKINKPNIDLGKLGETFEKLNLQEVFSSAFRPKFHHGFKLAALIALTYGLGKIVAITLTPSPDLRNQRPQQVSMQRSHGGQYYDAVKKANPFKGNLVEKKAGPRKPQQKRQTSLCDTSSRRSSNSAKLINTIVLQNELKSVAAIQMRGKRKFVAVRRGDEVAGLGKIGKVEADKMIFRSQSTGECEYIAKRRSSSSVRSKFQVHKKPSARKMLDRPTGISNQGNNYSISRSFCKKQMGNIGNILTEAKAIPVPQPDGSLKFKVTQIKPAGLFSYLGIQDGDTIQRLNGDNIKSLTEIMGKFTKICSMNGLQISVLRGGSEVNLEYSFK